MTVLMAVVLAGCSNLDSAPGPLDRFSDWMDDGKPYVADPGVVTDAQRADLLAKALQNWEKSPRVASGYHIGPEDVLKVSIPGLKSPGDTSETTVSVDLDGTIRLAMVGRVAVGGMSPKDAEDAIGRKYAGRFLRNPEVSVAVTEHKSAAVLVSGAVIRPGLHFLRSDRTSVLELLVSVGGLSEDAGNELIVVRQSSAARGARTAWTAVASAGTNAAARSVADLTNDGSGRVVVDLRKLLEEGDLAWNVEVSKGDIVTVPPRRNDYVYVLGYVRSPGAVKITQGKTMTAMRAMAQVGGLTAQGRADKSYLVREKPDGKTETTQIDLAKIQRGVKPDLTMQAGDRLVIGAGLLMKITEIFKFGGSVGGAYTPIP